MRLCRVGALPVPVTTLVTGSTLSLSGGLPGAHLAFAWMSAHACCISQTASCRALKRRNHELQLGGIGTGGVHGERRGGPVPRRRGARDAGCGRPGRCPGSVVSAPYVAALVPCLRLWLPWMTLGCDVSAVVGHRGARFVRTAPPRPSTLRKAKAAEEAKEVTTAAAADETEPQPVAGSFGRGRGGARGRGGGRGRRGGGAAGGSHVRAATGTAGEWDGEIKFDVRSMQSCGERACATRLCAHVQARRTKSWPPWWRPS